MRILGRRARAADDAAPDPAAAGPRESIGVAPVGAVNGFAVLDAVAALPVSTWRYLWEPEGVRHLGPMAQDWHAAFGFNRDDTRIPVVDGLGVSLVCIQALQRQVEDLRAEVAVLREAAAGTPSEAGR
ncbi:MULTISPECIES: tail fiber domain-containing protein [Streptomyces]|uniref:Peptidase S74 domain-containing protein n=1 Tax=Streptomyces viridochromogenes TaxID=1938 RepID=A0A0L8LE86_STRVR|nr:MULTISPECIES: tail fiber domain-containing protein [Streptomyces]KOG36578.1 hypothetical protein ADK34_01200 [Streptomyces viridochromogenes]